MITLSHMPNITSASRKSLSTPTLELPFHKQNELAILDKNIDEIDMSVTSTREMITDFAANNVHMNDNDSQESVFKNSSIVPELTLIFPQSNWLKPNQHHIKASNANIQSCLNEDSLIPQIVNDSQVSSSGILHNDDKSKELALIDKTGNSTKIICDAKVSYQNNKPSSGQNPYCLTQHNSKASTQSDPELSSASLRENVTVDLMTFETFCKQVWFKGVENSQTVTNSKNRTVKTRSKCLRPLRPKTMNIKHKNDMDPKFPTKSKLIPSILRKKMTRPTTERSTENLIKSKIDNTQKQNSQCTNYSPTTKSEGKPSFGNNSTGAILTELPDSSAIPNRTPSKCLMDLAESKSEDDQGEPDSTIDILQFMLLKEMWNTRSRNVEQPGLADLKLAKDKLFVTLLEEFLKKHNCAKYIPQLTGLHEFLKKYNIGISIEDLNDAVDKSLIQMKIERVIGVKIITPSKSFDYSSTASTNAGQTSEDLQDLKRTLPPRSVKEKVDQKIIEKDKLNVPTLELQTDRNYIPIGKRRKRIFNQTINRVNEKQQRIKTISNTLDATHDFIECKCNETSVYKITLGKKKYAMPRCFFNDNFSYNNSMIVREACQLKPKMTRQRTHCFASMCDFIKRNGLRQFQKLFLEPMVKLELIRVPSYRNCLNEMLLSNTENLVLSNDTSTTASPVLELENTVSKNNENVDNTTQLVDRSQCDPEVQDNRCYIEDMDHKPVFKELVSISENTKSNENEVNEACLPEITHANDTSNFLSLPYSSSINNGIEDIQPPVCRIGDDSPELTLDEIKAETNLISSENVYRTYNANFHVPNFNFYTSVGLEETRKIVKTPKRLEIASDNYGPINSFYIISTPQWVPKSSGSQENCNDVMSLEMENKHFWVDNNRSIPFDTLSRPKVCKNHGEATVHTSVGSPTDISGFNQTIVVNVQNHDSQQNQYNGTLTPLSFYSSNLNLGEDKSTPFIYDRTPHIIRTQNTLDCNKKISVTSLKRKIAPRPPNNVVPHEPLNTTVKKSRTTIQSTPVPCHTKSNHTITKQSENNIAIEQPKQLIKMNKPRITSGVHLAKSSVGNKDMTKSATKNVRKERSKRHDKTIKINSKIIQKTNNREIVAAESTMENNEPTLNLRITSSASKDVTEATLINHDRSDENWYDDKEDNKSNLKQEYDFQNELYNKYFINLLKANGYHAKFRYSNTRLAVLSANITDLERAEKFVQIFEKFDSADYLIWRDAKQEKYLLHRTWLCAKNGEQKPNVAYENLPCQARIHISIRRAPSNTHNADVLIYKEHSHVS